MGFAFWVWLNGCSDPAQVADAGPSDGRLDGAAADAADAELPPDAMTPDSMPPPDAVPPPLGPMQLVLHDYDGAPLVGLAVSVMRPGHTSVIGTTNASGVLEVEVSAGSGITYEQDGIVISVLDVQPGDAIHRGVFNQAPASGQMTFVLPPGPTFMAYSLGGCTTLPPGAISEPCSTTPFTVGFVNFRFDAGLNRYVEQFTSVRNVTYVEGATVQGVGPWIDTPAVRSGFVGLPPDLTATFSPMEITSSGYLVHIIHEVAPGMVQLPDIGDLVEILAVAEQAGTGHRQTWRFRRPTSSVSLEVDASVLLPWPDSPMFDTATMTMRWQGDLGAATSVLVNLSYPCARGVCFRAVHGPPSLDRVLHLPPIPAHPDFMPTGPITTASLSYMHTSTGWAHERQRSNKSTRPNHPGHQVRVHPDFLPANFGRTDGVAAEIVNN